MLIINAFSIFHKAFSVASGVGQKSGRKLDLEVEADG
jgi:hypothetical protein